MIHHRPQVGVVNGLYANQIGLGGITKIEVHKTIGENLDLLLTGSQGKVMKESMHCAKTLAWNLLTEDEKSLLDWKNIKLHIHCPEAATAKDGPSAGVTITTAILSRLTNKKVDNTIAMTGEIDLNGNVHAIGGLDAKLFGAIRAGARTIFIPSDNDDDYAQFVRKNPEIDINVISVEHVSEIVTRALITS